MRLEELLSSLARLAETSGTSTPYIVGGFSRDRAMGLPIADVSDIDLTTGDDSAFALSMAASREWPTARFRSYDDGHSSLDFKNIRVDFSNNFLLPGIDAELGRLGIGKPTPLQREIFSRDFTINTLLQPLDLSKEPLDPTGRGLEDVKKRRLATPVNPELTIGYDPRRILRALKLVMQFDLAVDDDLRSAMIKYRGALRDMSVARIRKQVNQMLKMDPRKTILLLSEYKLLPIIPLSRMMAMELARHRMVQHLVDGS
jgi:tRNA nucleotidyltransferase/poly(A) polymerase